MKTKAGEVRETPAAVRGRVPKLRFPEFRARLEWESKPLGDVCGVVAERAAVSHFTSYDYVNTESLLPDYAGNTAAMSLPPAGTATVFQRGDVLVSNIRPYLKKVWHADMNGGASNDVIVLRASPDLDDAYFSYLTRNDSFIDHIMAGAKGMKMPRGDLSLILQYPVGIPGTEEQRKIAACLSSLDELIAAQAKKLEVLKTYKKGLMQALFPAEGETVPRLRFPEFKNAGEWEERSIGTLLHEVSRPIDMQDKDEYSLVTVKRRYGGVVPRGTFTGASIAVKSQFLIETNDFLISKRQIVHNACGLVPKELAGSIVSNEYAVLVPDSESDVTFINHWAQQPVVSTSFLHCSIGIHIEKMLFKTTQWLAQAFLIPTLPEQRKIASTLASLDELIAAQKKQIEALNQHKRGLMQGLFPAMEEDS